MKINAKAVLAMALIMASLNSAHASATDCLEEGRNAELEHVQGMMERHQDLLNSNDIVALKEDARILGRIVARSCFIIEQKKK